MDISTTVTLNNGVKIPALGLGVFKSGKDTYTAVRAALDAGYRHIDTAMIYENEAQVGKAVKDSRIPREQIFITTKLWTDDMRSCKVPQALETSLKLLDMDYTDLYLIHWPLRDAKENICAYLEMEKLLSHGKTRALGVSNFEPHHLDELAQGAGLLPAVNQIESNPYMPNTSVLEYCARRGIAAEAWSPLARGRVVNEPKLNLLASKYNKTVPQIVIRWHLQRGIIVIPKSIKKERIIENSKVFDFELAEGEMALVSALDINKRSGSHPDEYKY